jgi:hypothetical protein
MPPVPKLHYTPVELEAEMDRLGLTEDEKERVRQQAGVEEEEEPAGPLGRPRAPFGMPYGGGGTPEPVERFGRGITEMAQKATRDWETKKRRGAHRAGLLLPQEVEQVEALGMPVPGSVDPRPEDKRPVPLQATTTQEEQEEEEGPDLSRIGFRDGVFTNIGVTPDEEDAYGRAVMAFRSRAASDQANNELMETLGLRTPTSERSSGISVSGVPRPRRDFDSMIDTSAPVPGMPNYPEGGFVSQPFMADPTKEVTSEGWADMSPLAKETYLNETNRLSQTMGARGDAIRKQAEARMVMDPTFPVEHRKALWEGFRAEAKDSPRVQQQLQEWTENWLSHPDHENMSQTSPEFRQQYEAIEKVFIDQYLKERYDLYAPWDDTLGRNVGLTLTGA